VPTTAAPTTAPPTAVYTGPPTIPYTGKNVLIFTMKFELKLHVAVKTGGLRKPSIAKHI
jgi:hypothetical protein